MHAVLCGARHRGSPASLLLRLDRVACIEAMAPREARHYFIPQRPANR